MLLSRFAMGAVCCASDRSGDHHSRPKCEAHPDLKSKAVAGFKATFEGAEAAALGVAPGRCEVVGNHTDYNEGFILSCAVDRYVLIAGAKAKEAKPEGEENEGQEVSTKCRVTSEMFAGKIVEFDAKNPVKQTGENAWANYVIGVVDELNKLEGVTVTGFDAFVTTNVPAGAGVSSSAAVEMATAKLLAQLFPSVHKMDDLALILAAKAAENNFVGMGCGVLDQFSSCMGRTGRLIHLDCRPPLKHTYVEFQGGAFVLANTHAPHQLVDGKYDELRKACFESVDVIKKAMASEITHLRDVDSETLEKNKDALSEDQYKRAEHIVKENERVMGSVTGLKKGDLAVLGKAMSESHNSSRDKFGNSCEQLDKMRECAEGIDGWLGGRLMGGGFGGCTINLVELGKEEAFAAALAEKYEAATGTKPTMICVNTGDGAFGEKL